MRTREESCDEKKVEDEQMKTMHQFQAGGAPVPLKVVMKASDADLMP